MTTYDNPVTETMVDRMAWKEGEYHYCVALVRAEGSDSVSRGNVASYLRLQGQSASKDGETAISTALWGAARILQDNPCAFESAFIWLVDQREKIAGVYENTVDFWDSLL